MKKHIEQNSKPSVSPCWAIKTESCRTFWVYRDGESVGSAEESSSFSRFGWYWYPADSKDDLGPFESYEEALCKSGMPANEVRNALGAIESEPDDDEVRTEDVAHKCSCCPFCGVTHGQRLVHRGDTGEQYVQCSNCGARGSVAKKQRNLRHGDPKVALLGWNQRAKENAAPLKPWFERAKERMQEIGVTQESLKDILGVETRGAVGHYLSGRRDPTPAQLSALAKKLRMSMDEMMG